MDRGAWWARVHGVAKNWTRLGNQTTTTTIDEIFFLSNAKLGNQLTASHLFSRTILWFNIAIYPHFTNEDTKTQQGQVMSLRHSNSMTEVVIQSSLQPTYHLATKPALLS